LTNAAESDINHKSTIAEVPGELLQKAHFSGKRMSITYDADAQVMISEFFRYFLAWRNAKLLIGTSMCWFFVDVAYVCLLEPFYCHLFYLHNFYSINLNQNVVLEKIGFAGKKRHALGTNVQGRNREPHYYCLGFRARYATFPLVVGVNVH